MHFSILIATMYPREGMFREVLKEVQRQISELPSHVKAEVLWEVDNGELTLGAKRNILVDRANGKYHCFVDDDDIISPNYLRTFIPMIEYDYDCASFLGAYYNKGKFEKLFFHSLDIKEWNENDDMFLRCISPMNMIRTDIVRQLRYKDIRNTEDHEFSIRLMQSGLLHKEYKIPFTPIYHYLDRIKEDRHEWGYTWADDSKTRLSLFKPSQRKESLPFLARIPTLAGGRFKF